MEREAGVRRADTAIALKCRDSDASTHTYRRDMIPLSNRGLIQLSTDRAQLQSPVLMQLLGNILIAMQEGTIARLTDKGFGFIKVEGLEKDLFFHSNELVNVRFDELREGDKVSFESAESPKGPNAVKVSRV